MPAPHHRSSLADRRGDPLGDPLDGPPGARDPLGGANHFDLSRTKGVAWAAPQWRKTFSSAWISLCIVFTDPGGGVDASDGVAGWMVGAL